MNRMPRKYAIIGYPVEHSLSPVMHEAGFKAVGLNAEYHKIPLQPADLRQGLDFLRESGYQGWNVTYPLKEHILPLMDILTPAATNIGAVNTVKLTDGLLQGHNTDGEGFLLSLSTHGYHFPHKKAVILGAGGAAKAIATALAEREMEILIVNRTNDKAKNMAEHISALGGRASWGNMADGDWLTRVDLLIQTTPVGMKGEDHFLDLRGIPSSAWVIDLIYNPRVTPFLRQAKEYGCKTMNGLEMLLYQGVLAWEYWLKMKAPISVMGRALQEHTAQ